MSDRELIEMLAAVIERNTGAMERVTSAVENNAKMIAENAEKNRELAANMRHLTGTIRGAQEKIGGEIGSVIEKQKATSKALVEEILANVKARDDATGSGTDG